MCLLALKLCISSEVLLSHKHMFSVIFSVTLSYCLLVQMESGK